MYIQIIKQYTHNYHKPYFLSLRAERVSGTTQYCLASCAPGTVAAGLYNTAMCSPSAPWWWAVLGEQQAQSLYVGAFRQLGRGGG